MFKISFLEIHPVVENRKNTSMLNWYLFMDQFDFTFPPPQLIVHPLVTAQRQRGQTARLQEKNVKLKSDIDNV